jgi:hypothetical protein
MAEKGDYMAPVFATLLVSITSLVKPALSAVYGRVSAVASVSAVPPSLSNGHRKCSKNSNMSNTSGLLSWVSCIVASSRL